MISVGQYLEAATRPNTQRAYAAATRHFEVEWGGHLPTTAEQVARYLAIAAGRLRQYVAAGPSAGRLIGDVRRRLQFFTHLQVLQGHQ